MPDGRLKNATRNIIAGGISKIVSLLFPFIIRTIIIKEIGIEYAGINSLFSSILMVLSISELGFGSAMVYSMYKPIAEKNVKKVSALLNLYRKVFIFVGIFILGAGLLLMPFLNFLVRGDCPDDLNIYVLYLIFLLNSVISYFAFSYKSALLTAIQREDINSNILTCVNFIMYAVQIIVLITLKNFMAYIIIMPVCTFAVNLIRSAIVNKIYPEYRCTGSIDKSELKEIYKNVRALIGHKISGTIILSADNIVISAALGLTSVALYNNYYYIINALVGFFIIYFNAIRPSVGNSIVTESVKKNYSDFKTITVITMWLAGWCSICMICLFKPFIVLWLGSEYLLPTATGVILGIYFYVWKMVDVLILYRDAAGMWTSDFWRPYIVSIFNIVGNIMLVNIFGLNGVVFATLFSYLCISYPWVTKVLFKDYFKNGMKEYIKTVLSGSVLVIAVGSITYLTVSLIHNQGIITFIVKCIVCVLLPNIVFLIAFEKKYGILNRLKVLLK